MSRHGGLLVVNRFELLRQAERSGSLSNRMPATGRDHEDVFRRYRGFDGLAWPEVKHEDFSTAEGLADPDVLGPVDAYVEKLPHRHECEVILLAPLDAAGLDVDGWRRAGFDVGYFESEWSHFSVVLNEIIYGTRLELRRFANVLNEHLLVPTLDLALEVIVERSRLAGIGADVEEVPHVEPVAILLREDRTM